MSQEKLSTKELADQLEFDADCLLNLLMDDFRPNVGFMRDLISTMRLAVVALRETTKPD